MPKDFDFRPNPNLERELQREIGGNLPSGLTDELRNVRCPDHPEHRFEAISEAGRTRLAVCCQKGAEVAGAATGWNIEWTGQT
jgi:hypothetical protein